MSHGWEVTKKKHCELTRTVPTAKGARKKVKLDTPSLHALSPLVTGPQWMPTRSFRCNSAAASCASSEKRREAGACSDPSDIVPLLKRPPAAM